MSPHHDCGGFLLTGISIAGQTWGQGKILHQSVVGMEQAAQGSGHSPELSEFYECLDSALRHRVWILGGAAYSQELDSVILMGTLHLRDIL